MLFEQNGMEAAGGAEGGTPVIQSFFDFIITSPLLERTVWIMLGFMAVLSLILLVTIVISLRNARNLPDTMDSKIRERLENGDLNGAVSECAANSSVYAGMLLAGFASIAGGYDAVLTGVSVEADMEKKRLMRKINLLGGCAVTSAALGFLASVVGISGALVRFAEMRNGDPAFLAASASASLSAVSAGFLIAIPACAAYFLAENAASRTILSLERLAHSRIRVLSRAKVVSEEPES